MSEFCAAHAGEIDEFIALQFLLDCQMRKVKVSESGGGDQGGGVCERIKGEVCVSESRGRCR